MRRAPVGVLRGHPADDPHRQPGGHRGSVVSATARPSQPGTTAWRWPAPRGTGRSPLPCRCRWRSAAQRGAVERVSDVGAGCAQGLSQAGPRRPGATSRGRARAQQASRPALGPQGGGGMTLDRLPSHLSVARLRVCAAGFPGFSWDGAGGCLPDAERVADSPAGVNGCVAVRLAGGLVPLVGQTPPMPAVRAVTPGRACQGLLARRHDRERAPGRGAGLAVLAGLRIGGVPELLPALSPAERKVLARTQARRAARRRELITELRVGGSLLDYATRQLSNGIGPGEASEVCLEVAAELARLSVALRKSGPAAGGAASAPGARLAGLGYTREATAARAGVSVKTVQRDLAAGAPRNRDSRLPQGRPSRRYTPLSGNIRRVVIP